MSCCRRFTEDERDILRVIVRSALAEGLELGAQVRALSTLSPAAHAARAATSAHSMGTACRGSAGSQRPRDVCAPGHQLHRTSRANKQKNKH